MPIIDRDSPHFAQATRQMLETRNFFQIRFQETTRFQKPPGINWLQALTVKIFSNPQSTKLWPYLLPSILGSLFSVWLTFGFTKYFFGSGVGFFAAALLASSLLLNIESHLAVTDSSLLSAIVLMQGSLWIIYIKSSRQQTSHWLWPLLFWLALSYGILLKGINLLVASLTIISLIIIDKNYLWLKQLRWWGIPLLLISSCWLLGLNAAEHSNYLMQMLHHDLLPKLAGGHESHGLPFGSHLVLLILTFWPASLFLPYALLYGWQCREHPAEKFLLAWIIPTWIFFELMPTKLPQYVLPTFPALAILTSLGIHRCISLSDKFKLITKIYAYGWLLFSIGFAIVLLLIPYFLSHQLKYLSIIVALIMVLSTWTALQYKANLQRAAQIIIAGSLIALAPLYQFILPGMRELWLSNQIASQLASVKISDERPLLSLGYNEPSLVFLLGTHRVKFVSLDNIIKLIIESQGSYVLVDDHLQAQLLKMTTENNLGLKALATISGFNYNYGKWVKLSLYQVIRDQNAVF